MIALLAASLILPGTAPAPTPIKPSQTDPAITAFDDPHLVYRNQEAKKRNELLIFIPGTNGKPGGTNLFCQTAADLGYHTLALAYPSSVPATAARNDPDPDAFEDFRMEIIFGGDRSKYVEVDRTNSIESRLIKLLQYLAKNEPSGGWSQYLSDGKPVWAKIAVSGHSQGGGHAGLIAVHRRVARAIMTGAPKDFDRARNKPAAWYRKAATPVSGMFTFNHELDQQGCDIQEQMLICKALGLAALGGAVSVDTNPPPFKNSRILTTHFEGSPTESPRAHSTVIGDAIGPKAKDGAPKFRPVWVYMMTAEVK